MDTLYEHIMLSNKEREQNLLNFQASFKQRIGEMEEIADTFDQVGVTPYFHHGAAETFRLLSETHLAKETPESIDQKRTLTQTISIVARSLIPKTK